MRRALPGLLCCTLFCSMLSAASAGDPFASPLGAMKIPRQPPQRTLLGLPAAPGFFAALSGQRQTSFRSQRPVIPQTTTNRYQSQTNGESGQRSTHPPTQSCPDGVCPLIRPSGALASPAGFSTAPGNDQKIHTQQLPKQQQAAPLADPFRSPNRQLPFDPEWMRQPVRAPRLPSPLPSALLPANPYRQPLRTLRHHYQPEVPRFVETAANSRFEVEFAAGVGPRSFVSAN